MYRFEVWKSELLPYNWERKCLAATQPSFSCRMPLHQHQTCCQNNWLQRGWVSPWKNTEQPFPTTFARALLHEAQHPLPTQGCRRQIPRPFFSISYLAQLSQPITKENLAQYSLDWINVISNALILKKVLQELRGKEVTIPSVPSPASQHIKCLPITWAKAGLSCL